MLIEAMVAILIFSIGVIAVIGLQAVALREVEESSFRSDASYLADRVVGEVTAANNNNPAARAGTYSATQNAADPWARAVADPTVPGSLPNGQIVVAAAGNQVTVTVTWAMRGVANNFTQVASIVD